MSQKIIIPIDFVGGQVQEIEIPDHCTKCGKKITVNRPIDPVLGINLLTDPCICIFKWDDLKAMAIGFTSCKTPVVTGKKVADPAVNNYTCPTCKNNRCNISEKLCWRCGNKL